MLAGTEAFAQRKPGNRKQAVAKVQNLRISLTERGYQPKSFGLKKGVRTEKGVPARVTFVRKTENECGRESVIPAYNIKRELR